MEGLIVYFTAQRRRGFFWALGIVSAATLSSLAWHQINAALTAYFSFF